MLTMGFSSATITKIDNGYILRIDYTLSHDEEFHRKSSTILKSLKNVLEANENAS